MYDVTCMPMTSYMISQACIWHHIPTIWCHMWCHIWRHNIAYDVICDKGHFFKFVKFLMFLDPLLTTKMIRRHIQMLWRQIWCHMWCCTKRDKISFLKKIPYVFRPLLTTDVMTSDTDVMTSDMIIVDFTHFVICDQLCWNNAFRHIWHHISLTAPFIIWKKW